MVTVIVYFVHKISFWPNETQRDIWILPYIARSFNNDLIYLYILCIWLWIAWKKTKQKKGYMQGENQEFFNLDRIVWENIYVKSSL